MNLNLLRSIPLCQTWCEAQGKLLDLSLLLSFALRTQPSVTDHCIAYSKLIGPSQSGAICFCRLPVFSYPLLFSLCSSHQSDYRCEVLEYPFPSCFNTSTNWCAMPHLILSLELPQIKGCLLAYSSQAESVFGCTEILISYLYSSISSYLIKG